MAATAIFEILIGKAFRQAEALRDKQLLAPATSALDFFVGFGEAIVARRRTGQPDGRKLKIPPSAGL